MFHVVWSCLKDFQFGSGGAIVSWPAGTENVIGEKWLFRQHYKLQKPGAAHSQSSYRRQTMCKEENIRYNSVRTYCGNLYHEMDMWERNNSLLTPNWWVCRVARENVCKMETCRQFLAPKLRQLLFFANSYVIYRFPTSLYWVKVGYPILWSVKGKSACGWPPFMRMPKTYTLSRL